MGLLNDFATKFLATPDGEPSTTDSGCPKGECVINTHVLYHTCDRPDCARLRDAARTSRDGIVDMVLLPYMKRLEQLEKSRDYENLDEEVDFVFDLLTEQLPNLRPFYMEIGTSFWLWGISRDNPSFCLFWDLREEEIFYSAHKVQALINREIGNTTLHLQHDFYRDPSLYLRTDADFDYTVKLFETVTDDEKLSKYYDPKTIDIKTLYDANGSIKPAGIGGCEKGYCGDTLWNTVESWEEKT